MLHLGKVKNFQWEIGDWQWLFVLTRSYINRPEVMTQYLNPLYEPNSACIWPSVAPQSLVSSSSFTGSVECHYTSRLPTQVEAVERKRWNVHRLGIIFQGIWSGLYQRWQKQQLTQRGLWQEIVDIKEHDKELKSKVIKLRRYKSLWLEILKKTLEQKEWNL